MHLKHSTLGLFAMAICAITACKKDDDAVPAVSAVGTWRPADESTTLKYLIIADDGYEYLLNSSELNLHTYQTYAYSADESQIFLDGSYFNDGGNFNYKVSNDTLYVEGGNYTKVLLRASNGPTLNTWIQELSITTKNTLPFIGNLGAMDWDGSQFIISSFLAKRLYKYNTGIQSITDSVDVSYKSAGFCYHNGGIWMNNYQNDEKLYKIDFVSGLPLIGSVNNAAPPVLPASDGNKIWAFGATDQKLYSYNDVLDAFTLEGTLSASLFSGLSSSVNGDIAIKNGYAYIAYGGNIGKFNLSTRLFEESYTLPGYLVAGIAYDGSDFWINGYTFGSSYIESEGLVIAKINLQ